VSVASESRVTRFIDYAIPALFLAFTLLATHALLKREVPDFLVTSLVTAPLAVAAAILERVRPERSEYKQLDQPFWIDAAHFLLPYQFGYALALGGCAAVGHFAKGAGLPPVWPGHWPLLAQVALAALVAEGVSYWQHRLFHHVPFLWRFHALHHGGERLNLLRAGRFHFVDIGLAAFMGFAPLVALGAPGGIITWVVTISGALGVLEHANMRMRTPVWLGYVVCTPALHRHHHSKAVAESNRNFGTLFMFFDLLFGSYERPRPDGPVAVGIEGEPMANGFFRQVFAPFRAVR
jgi:sterol desaturase/sphingolipid hydroxylase (fatty acid hydroxylase superfamily)